MLHNILRIDFIHEMNLCLGQKRSLHLFHTKRMLKSENPRVTDANFFFY